MCTLSKRVICIRPWSVRREEGMKEKKKRHTSRKCEEGPRVEDQLDLEETRVNEREEKEGGKKMERPKTLGRAADK
jgi:hypothetical protein